MDYDFLSVGRHCAVPDCRQLDYLPFTCAHCKLVTCTEHREHHNCTVSRPSVSFFCLFV
eukprot:m.66043 g.66043  ORF g.66043 m.66043 type:complete len:59 (-) comp12641_c0_seq1:526-702(-)